MQKTKEIIKQVRKIEITTKRLVDGIIAGNYHSIFKGQGIEFSEIRGYKLGDDIRTIDWKVTARFNKPYVKEFVEERDLNVYFIFDFSASNSFGDTLEKKNKAIEITATLMFSAIRNNDNAGLLIFTDKVEKFIPARKGKRHALKMISSLVSYKPESARTDISSALSFFLNAVKKHSIIFILSDFYNQYFDKQLKALRKKHDVIAVKINDIKEIDIPDVGWIQLEDEETGEQILVNTSDSDFRENYLKIINNEEERLRKIFNRNKVDVIQIYTRDSYEIPLKKFFKMRQKKRGIK